MKNSGTEIDEKPYILSGPASLPAFVRGDDRRATDIKFMEEVSLNAWPSYRIELYDGWLLRFSYNYSYRTNSVEQIAASSIPVEEKIDYCESVYSAFNSPTSFKINPLLDPEFDHRLAVRGYNVRHITEVMTCEISDFNLQPETGREYLFENRLGLPSVVRYGDIAVQLNPSITDEWIQGLFHLNGTSDPTLRRIVPSMYAAIPKQTLPAAIEIDGRIVATALGIRDRDYVGLYAVYVSPSCWKRGYARALCSTILREAQELGARRAYLQVVRGNERAKNLYRSLGFTDFYTYWFRSADRR